MAVKYWMISNREVLSKGKGLGPDRGEKLFYTSTGERPLTEFAAWQPVTPARFKESLVARADKFPALEDLPDGDHEGQKHLTIFVHGYNNEWTDAAWRYEKLVGQLFSGPESLGICILFNWPSNGDAAGYLPDRRDARDSAEDLADVLSTLYDWLLDKQAACTEDHDAACKAKTSVIAHSMGNYLVQCAMQTVWTRKNRPLLVSLINQLVMVAADVDNDIFRDGEDVGDADGEGIANLTYRVTAMYSGRDSTLGLSAGMKHFGKRRLGRSGLDRKYPLPDNVWDVDCSQFFKTNEKNVHSAYFEYETTVELMRRVLRGVDRTVLTDEGTAPPEEAVPVTPTAPGNLA
jgi:esterase/lipase superfamily enzyme